MTNAEKYLKDGVSVEELFNNYLKSYNDKIKGLTNYYTRDLNLKFLKEFLAEQAKFTLTVDERIILKNIKKDYTIVARDKAGNLFIATEFDEKGVRGHIALEFNRCLFRFIKERRRI